MGGKPNRGTKRDKRLRENKRRTAGLNGRIVKKRKD